MKDFTRHMLVLVICVIVMPGEIGGQDEAQDAAGGERTTNNAEDLVKKVCEKTPSQDLCVETIGANPVNPSVGGASATVKDLALSVLKVASKNASQIIQELKGMIDNDRLPPKVQQGLSDCKDMILNAQDQIVIAANAVTTNAPYDAKKWLQIALDATNICDDSLRGDEDVMIKKNDAFRQLCLIAFAVCGEL